MELWTEETHPQVGCLQLHGSIGRDPFAAGTEPRACFEGSVCEGLQAWRATVVQVRVHCVSGYNCMSITHNGGYAESLLG